MRFKKIALFSAFSIFSVSILAHATDVVIINKTDLYGTGYVKGSIVSSPCSSALGDRGIVKPNSDISIPLSVLKPFCSKCEAHLFKTKDCSGPEVATATIDSSKGIVSIKNLDEAHFAVVWSATQATVSPVKKGWKEWFKSLF